MFTTASPPRPPARRTPVDLLAPLEFTPDSNRLLVIRAASGDDRAFAELVRRHTPVMRATAARILRSHSEVDDVVQEAFIAAWSHIDTVIDGDTIVGWLLTTVRRRCYERLQSAGNQRRADLEIDRPDTPDRCPDAMSERSSLVGEVRAVLARMPELQRRCWELRQLEGRSYDQIAGELEVSTSVVRGQLARARQLMQTTLSHWR